eukprot:TRINITY_DN17787_c0_g5_i1.p1 TRINITY_DN17787_c0_g5~~TRINITY_DN17787_c0_g5_i1.p1  ORF type:complete len:226 (-),score=21.30 TRINITY_DN17787_c0_g5_i1:294-971(-)
MRYHRVQSCMAHQPALLACCLWAACFFRCRSPSGFVPRLGVTAVPAEPSPSSSSGSSSSPTRASWLLPSSAKQKQQPDGRRHLAALLALSAVALIAAPAEPSQAAARGTPKSKFAGKYSATSETLETNFTSCPREIFVAFDGTKGRIKGDDPILPQPDAERNCGIYPVKTWSIPFTISASDEIVFEEGSESITTRRPTTGGPNNVAAKWDGNGLLFPDGTKWTKK